MDTPTKRPWEVGDLVEYDNAALGVSRGRITKVERNSAVVVVDDMHISVAFRALRLAKGGPE